MKLYYKVISIYIVIFMLTLSSCTNDDTVSNANNIYSETTNSTELVTSLTTETLQDTIDTIIPAPDADLVTHIIASWGGSVDIAAKTIPENVNYYKLGASPNGEATAFYVDVDGDTQKEFCLVTDSWHGSCMCICEYTDEQGWIISDSLTISPKHTYLMAEDGGTYLFAAVGVKPMEGLTSYTYKNGAVNEFELVNIDDIDVFDDESYHKRISEAIRTYSNLTNLYEEYPMAHTEDVYTFYWYLAGLNEVTKMEYDLAVEKFMSQINLLFEN